MRFKCSLSSGIPVYGQNLVWRSLGQVTSQHATPSCRQLVWRKVFELNWFHLNCNPKYTKNRMILISNAWTEWCWSTHTFEDQNWYPLQSRKLQFKDEFTETCPLAAWSIVMASFQTGMDECVVRNKRFWCAIPCFLSAKEIDSR